MFRSPQEALTVSLEYAIKSVPVFSKFVFEYLVCIVLIATLIAAGHSIQHYKQIKVILYFLVVLLALSYLFQVIGYFKHLGDRIYPKIKFLPGKYQQRSAILIISFVQLLIFCGMGYIYLFVFDTITTIINLP